MLVRKLRGAAVLLREAPALPYNRYLPGEIMFWDIDDIAESLSWDPDPRALKSWLRSPDLCRGRPVPACWVIYRRGLFLVNRDLTGFADMARRHGLTVTTCSGGVPWLAISSALRRMSSLMPNIS